MHREEARRRADELVAERVQLRSTLSDGIIERTEMLFDRIDAAGHVKRQIDDLLRSLGEAAETVAREAGTRRAAPRPAAAHAACRHAAYAVAPVAGRAPPRPAAPPVRPVHAGPAPPAPQPAGARPAPRARAEHPGASAQG